MLSLLKFYLETLKRFYRLQLALYSILEPVITLKPINLHNCIFCPKSSSISEQIRQWPKGEVPIPPAGWVEPRKGIIKLDGEIWEFTFHGAGVSFIHSQTGQDVSIEYSVQGDLSITKWTLQVYLETLNPKETYSQDLLIQHPNLFDELVQLGYLVEVPPLLPFDDQTFVFIPDP